jgi:hypothetical protein
MGAYTTSTETPDSTVTDHSQRRRRNSCQPSRTLAKTFSAASPRWLPTRSRLNSTALTRNDNASAARAPPGLDTAVRSAPRPGPTTVLTAATRLCMALLSLRSRAGTVSWLIA